MRSENERIDKWIDLPSLTRFKGKGDNFGYIGSVILESSHLVTDWTRYSPIIIQWNWIRYRSFGWPFPIRLFPPTLKYTFSHLIIIRCHCSRFIYQKQKQVCLILIPSVSLNPIHIDNHESLNTQFTNPWSFNKHHSHHKLTSFDDMNGISHEAMRTNVLSK